MHPRPPGTPYTTHPGGAFPDHLRRAAALLGEAMSALKLIHFAEACKLVGLDSTKALKTACLRFDVPIVRLNRRVFALRQRTSNYFSTALPARRSPDMAALPHKFLHISGPRATASQR